MGYSRWDAASTATYTATSALYSKAISFKDVFINRNLITALDPKHITMRESRRSEANPNPTPIILALDDTGSMGTIAHNIAAHGLGTLIKEIFDRTPVTDPHIMFMAVGDVEYDHSPLQASQFETDYTMVEQLSQLFIEGNGGGNFSESYNLPWHFAQFHTSADAFEKDGRKGYLFTFGDELVPPDLTSWELDKVYGKRQEQVRTNRQLLDDLVSKYHVFHLMIEEGNFMKHAKQKVAGDWIALLGENAIPVSNYKALSEIIISIMQVNEGADKQTVIDSWSDQTKKIVEYALKNFKGFKELYEANTTDNEVAPELF